MICMIFIVILTDVGCYACSTAHDGRWISRVSRISCREVYRNFQEAADHGNNSKEDYVRGRCCSGCAAIQRTDILSECLDVLALCLILHFFIVSLCSLGCFQIHIFFTAGFAVLRTKAATAFSKSQPSQFCPSVCPSHGQIRQKRGKLGSPNLHRRLPGRLQFQEP